MVRVKISPGLGWEGPAWKIVAGAPEGLFQRGKSPGGRHQGFWSVEMCLEHATRGGQRRKSLPGRECPKVCVGAVFGSGQMGVGDFAVGA